MTEIKWYLEKDSFGICANGHADYNPGNDIVCSAVSALLQTLYAGLELFCGTAVDQEQESGSFVLEGQMDSEGARVLFDSTLFGLGLIEREYPDNVRIERVGAGFSPLHGGGGNPFSNLLQ